MYFPPGYNYLSNHHWFQKLGKQDLLVGITDLAEQKIGRIESIEFRRKGTVLRKNEKFGKIFGSNMTFDLIMPASGKLLAINHMVARRPDLINCDPYQNWIVMIACDTSTPDEPIDCLTANNYSIQFK